MPGIFGGVHVRSFDGEAEFAPKSNHPLSNTENPISYHAKEYEVYVVLGAPGVLPWAWSVWREIAPLLSPFVGSPRGKPFVRSSQTMGLGKQHRSVAFGRMGWDQKSHASWTHGSPTSSPDAETWNFVGTEVWAPSWNVCEKNLEAPDFYMHLLCAPPCKQDHSPQFSSILVVAFAASSAGARRVELRAAMTTIAKLLDSPFSVWKHRAWGIPVGLSGGFRDAVQDFGVGSGLFKNADPHERRLGLDTFTETWATLYQN
ncbi:hypothetical protein [Variovorax sp. YR566]|uniref:hypothetical protein n=1 Tax=Variovorax sp. YR566 TaxID=3450237 RepID=UPI003F7F1C80